MPPHFNALEHQSLLEAPSQLQSVVPGFLDVQDAALHLDLPRKGHSGADCRRVRPSNPLFICGGYRSERGPDKIVLLKYVYNLEYLEIYGNLKLPHVLLSAFSAAQDLRRQPAVSC